MPSTSDTNIPGSSSCRLRRHRAKKSGCVGSQKPVRGDNGLLPFTAPVRNQGRQACLKGFAIRWSPDHVQGHGSIPRSAPASVQNFRYLGGQLPTQVSGNPMHQHFVPVWYRVSCKPPIDITKGSGRHWIYCCFRLHGEDILPG